MLHNPRTPFSEGLKAVKWFGKLTVIGSTLLILLSLEFGGVIYPWSSGIVICPLVFGVLFTVLFIVIEGRFVKFPIIPLTLFAKKGGSQSFL